MTTDGRSKTSRLVVHSWLNATELVLKGGVIALPLVRRALSVDSLADGTGQSSGSGPVEVRHISVLVVRYDGSERTAHISARILTGGLPPI